MQWDARTAPAFNCLCSSSPHESGGKFQWVALNLSYRTPQAYERGSLAGFLPNEFHTIVSMVHVR